MTASLTARDGRLLLDGVVGFDNAASICATGESLLTDLQGDVVLDLSSLRNDASIVVAVIVQWARSAARAGKRFRLQAVPDKLAAIIRVSGLQETLSEQTLS